MVAVVVIALALGPGHHGATAQASAPGPWNHPSPANGVRAERVTRELARALARVPAHSRWLASWGAAPQAASAYDSPSLRGFADQTIREITLLSSDGAAVRIHLSNAYGRRPLIIGKASVAIAGSFGHLATSPRPLTFHGEGYVSIPVGGSVVSDPVVMSVHALERLAVSLYLPESTGVLTYHGTAEQSAFVGAGDAVSRSDASWSTERLTSWYLLTGVDTLSPPRYGGSVAAFGDSITAGYRSSLDTFGAWPDDLARRLSRLSGPSLSVIDEGISGNRVLNASPCCGASGLSRFRADVLDQAGVRDVILLEGINDIGFSQSRNPLTAPHTDVSAAQIIDADKRIIAAAHADGLRIFGATLLPFKGAGYWTPAGEQKRHLVNVWIRDSGAFAGVIDFAAAMAEPGHPQVLNPAYNSGDHLHPNNAGYLRMANTIRLAMLISPPKLVTAAPHTRTRATAGSPEH